MAEKNIYLIAGDAFLRKAECEALLAKLQSSIQGQCEIQAFDVTDTPPASIFSSARTLPFLADAQILRIKQADKLKEEGIDHFEAYLKNPSASSYLVFEADKADERSRFVKLVQEHGVYIKPSQADRAKREVQFLRGRLSEAKKTLTPGAQKQILEMCGESPVFLGTMLDRLILFAGEKPQIDESMVAQFEEDWAEANVFELSDAILEQNGRKAVQVLKKLIEIEGDVYSVMGFVHFQVKRLWQAKALAEEGAAASQIAARLNLKPFQANALFRNLEKFSLQRLEEAVEGLYQLDWRSKSGRAEIIPALEIWLLKTTAPAGKLVPGRGRL